MCVKGHAFVRNRLPKGLQAVDSALFILLETTSNPFVCQRLKAKETFAAKKSAPLSTAAYGTTVPWVNSWVAPSPCGGQIYRPKEGSPAGSQDLCSLTCCLALLN